MPRVFAERGEVGKRERGARRTPTPRPTIANPSISFRESIGSSMQIQLISDPDWMARKAIRLIA
ncbi:MULTISPECIES: hypothetical protein [Paraburkholderia]|uniref:hypothetical protein n=1 Tax=Paraburkholderia TaxID=1822464 RepID=UPI0007EE07ED|nr:hypothetical protein [Paraburkholderia tropica]MBB2984391.1 hypothetical protein [Paraburkholderia tropica]OBR47703.1 hypothetical protein A6456_28960 [Paraburkholderia tropica]